MVEPLLPVSGVKGRPRVDDRRVVNGMLYKARTGVAGGICPSGMGRGKTVYTRFWRWSRDDTLARLVGTVRVVAEVVAEMDREVSVDSTIVRMHQHRGRCPFGSCGPHSRRSSRMRPLRVPRGKKRRSSAPRPSGLPHG